MSTLVKLTSNWNLPPQKKFGWKMKPLDSAKTEFVIDNDRVYRLHIEHDILHGVSPKMLLWWFKNIGGEMTYQGKVYNKYLVWHPEDHIHWSLVNHIQGREVGPGSYFRIVEAFNRNKDFMIDSVELVEKLDETGIRLTRKIGGIDIFSLQHDFTPQGENTIYKSQMVVGTNGFAGRIFNPYIRPFIFTEQMGLAWLKHNIEEVGNFEFFLPELFWNENEKLTDSNKSEIDLATKLLPKVDTNQVR